MSDWDICDGFIAWEFGSCDSIGVAMGLFGDGMCQRNRGKSERHFLKNAKDRVHYFLVCPTFCFFSKFRLSRTVRISPWEMVVSRAQDQQAIVTGQHGSKLWRWFEVARRWHWCYCSKRTSLSFVNTLLFTNIFNHVSLLHNKNHIFKRANIVQWIFFDCNNIGKVAILDKSDLSFSSQKNTGMHGSRL